MSVWPWKTDTDSGFRCFLTKYLTFLDRMLGQSVWLTKDGWDQLWCWDSSWVRNVWMTHAALSSISERCWIVAWRHTHTHTSDNGQRSWSRDFEAGPCRLGFLCIIVTVWKKLPLWSVANTTTYYKYVVFALILQSIKLMNGAPLRDFLLQCEEEHLTERIQKCWLHHSCELD